MMELPLFVLVLLSFCVGQIWMTPDYCEENLCPQPTLIETNKEFEERFYDETKWITTKIEGTTDSDVLAAHSRLKNVAGNLNSWPVLITNSTDILLCWFLPPGTAEPTITDSKVKIRSRPKGNVYVSKFSGLPSISIGRENAKVLCDNLRAAGKTCDDPYTYTGAGYDSYFSFTHRNEIWIDKAQ